MSFPFGGHPTLEMFIEYVKANGCEVTTIGRLTKSGRPYTACVLVNPAGGVLTLPDPDITERLSPYMISQYQRRLGLKTPFPSAPEPPEDSTQPRPSA